MTGRLAKPSRPSDPPTAIPPPAGSISTSKGKPYERGYQHGYLMAREIPEYLERCAADLGTKDHRMGRPPHPANALFLRGFDREILEEMRGIADGASDAGARVAGPPPRPMDIVVANITVELGELAAAVSSHRPPAGEGSSFEPPPYCGSETRFGDSIIAAPSPPPDRPLAMAKW